MKKACIYKSAHVVLAATGFCFGVSIFFIHQYIRLKLVMLFWGFVIITLTSTGLLLGVLIKQLYQYSNKDPLTGLNNRRYFYDTLSYEIEKLKKYKNHLSLAIIDIDNFKNINDTYGHIEGDRVLQELSNILRKSVREYDTVARWGGEEFAIILPRTDNDGAFALGERIRKIVEAYAFGCNVTISIGIASIKDSIEIEKFIILADETLYKAKKKKNRVESRC
ncbi:GGDEF domain-containing protein [Clostridium manihotivorum]|uniref:GGDEF domain-containing protein n=1 Tax=Clostridium manihotivorum TaxID=2320868 RepID=A0A410DUG6_9CLOT|nr:GGDEF domain-containing protein [Clostridium manihotivorum]ERI90697.1 diguanylate cyclase domain protein [Clostridiales bacterium oral taxon 876 str. F0540]QAA32719.1 GGDEF domain-containing protein [Clostridium manihotivorum]